MPPQIKKRIRQVTDWRTWLRGIIGGAIGGGANSITMMIVDHNQFNFEEGFPSLWKVALVSAVVGAALFLKQNTLPARLEIDEEEEEIP